MNDFDRAPGGWVYDRYGMANFDLPHNEGGDTRESNQRIVDCASSIRDGQESNARDQVGKQQCDPWHPSLVHPAQNSRRLPVPRHEKYGPRRDIQRWVTRTEDSNHDDRVDQWRSSVDSRIWKRDREWRLCGFGSLRQKAFVVPWDQYADEEHHSNVEDQDTPEDLTDGAWYGSPWISCFTGCDSNHFCAGIKCTCDDKGIGDAINWISESAGCGWLLSAGLLGRRRGGSVRLCQYLKPIFWGPMIPPLMKIATMKKMVILIILILHRFQHVQYRGRRSAGSVTYKDSQNSISP